MRTTSLTARWTLPPAFVQIAAIGLGLALATGCSKDPFSETTTETLTSPTINAFNASSTGITQGQTVTLAWNVTDGTNATTGDTLPTTISIDNGLGVQTGSQVTVSPTATTTYRITATNKAGNTTSVITITVVPATSGTLSRLAGLPEGSANVDGAAGTACFNHPSDVACATDGSIFVTDTANNTIRKIAADGTVSTYAGQVGFSGFADGKGLAVTFNGPSCLAVDASNNLYVADTSNSLIRKIASDGTVTTLAGKALTPGVTNGKGLSARFNSPFGVALGHSGEIYVADTYNHLIRKIAADGTVTTFAGIAKQSGSLDGKSNVARFNEPTGVAVDPSGNVFVADYGNHAIRKIAADGTVSTFAGSPGVSGSTDGTGSAALFNQPYHLRSDVSGNVYVTDMGSNVIRKIAPDGTVSTLAGAVGLTGTTNGLGSAARFYIPTGLDVDTNGNVFVADQGNNLIRKIAMDGTVSSYAGNATTTGAADGVGGYARFQTPMGLATDANGNAYVADMDNHTIRRVAPDGTVTTVAGTPGVSGKTDGIGTSAQFHSPIGVALDASGNIYVADSGNNTIRKITPSGLVSTLAGTAGTSGTTDGLGSAALFNYPRSLTVDKSTGTIYVSDSGNHTIRKIAADGTVTTLAGMAGTNGSSDGAGISAMFYWPFGLALDGSGNLYVADTSNNTIRKIALSTGFVTTASGTTGVSGSLDDSLIYALYWYPTGLTIDDAGNIYVADTGNSLIRKISTDGVVSTLVGYASRRLTVPGPLPASIATPHGVAFDTHGGNLLFTENSAVMKVSF